MRLCASALALLALVSATGCTGLQRVLGFDEQIARAERVARVAGRIDTEVSPEGPLVPMLARPSEVEGAPLIPVDTFVRERAGSYAFPVAPGRYLLGAYEDRNANGLLDPGERLLAPRANPVIEVGPGETTTRDIVLARHATTPPELIKSLDVFDLVARTPREQQRFSLWAWTV